MRALRCGLLRAPADFHARIDADLARWTPVIRAAKIRVN
jgi:hypothetical protein